MSRCDIVIPVWNRLEDTADCLGSVGKSTLYPYRLVIIDNASGEETAGYLRGLAKERPGDILLIRNEKNTGFIKAVNKGIRASDSEFVCVLNNDTLVAPGWLREMVEVINKDPGIGIVNPSSNTLGQRLPGDMTLVEHARESKPHSGCFVETGSAFGFCMLARRKLFDEIGLLDESYGMGNFDDTDFSLRAKEKGYKTVRAVAAYVHHKEQRSFNLRRTFRKDFARNRKIFESRWGRTRRIIVVLDSANSESLARLADILKENAKEKSWVYVITPCFDTTKFYRAYSNLSFYHPKLFFHAAAFFKILFKRKKPDVIYSRKGAFSALLKTAGTLRGAEIKNVL